MCQVHPITNIPATHSHTPCAMAHENRSICFYWFLITNRSTTVSSQSVQTACQTKVHYRGYIMWLSEMFYLSNPRGFFSSVQQVLLVKKRLIYHGHAHHDILICHESSIHVDMDIVNADPCISSVHSYIEHVQATAYISMWLDAWELAYNSISFWYYLTALYGYKVHITESYDMVRSHTQR